VADDAIDDGDLPPAAPRMPRSRRNEWMEGKKPHLAALAAPGAGVFWAPSSSPRRFRLPKAVEVRRQVGRPSGANWRESRAGEIRHRPPWLPTEPPPFTSGWQRISHKYHILLRLITILRAAESVFIPPGRFEALTSVEYPHVRYQRFRRLRPYDDEPFM